MFLGIQRTQILNVFLLAGLLNCGKVVLCVLRLQRDELPQVVSLKSVQAASLFLIKEEEEVGVLS